MTVRVKPSTIYVVIGGERYEGYRDELYLAAEVEGWWHPVLGWRRLLTYAIFKKGVLIYRGITQPVEGRDKAGNITYIFGQPSADEALYEYGGG